MLLNNQGRMAMIVMHNLCFSNGFQSLRDHVQEMFPSLWVSSYARRPDGLFAGSAAVRNSIVVGSRAGKAGFNTTRCRRWPAEGRDALFPSIEYMKPPKAVLDSRANQWPFVDEPVVAAAFAQMVGDQEPLSDASARGSFGLGFRKIALYMLGVYTEAPPTVDPYTRRPVTTLANQSGWLWFGEETQRDLALVMLAGRWGYLWWLMVGDEFHVTRGVLESFPGGVGHWAGLFSGYSVVPSTASDTRLVEELLDLSQELKRRMPEHMTWTRYNKLEVARYNMLNLRYLTDKADLLLAKLWGVEDAYEAAGNLRDRMVFGNKE